MEAPSISDEELARQTQAGSLTAFEELVCRYEARIYGFILQCCRGIDAREITQDTFVRAFQAISQFDSSCLFAPWLFTIARRKCHDHYRSRPPWDERQIPELPDEDDPAALLARAEDKQNLWALARSSLPQAQFQSLWLKYVEGMTTSEIARVLAKTRTHVKVLLFRARQSLRHKLAASSTSATQHNLCPGEMYEKLAYKI